MTTIKDNLKKIQDKIENVKLKSGTEQRTEIIAVTKTHPFLIIQECYKAGIHSIGENKIQEAEGKFRPHPETPQLKKRFIGHLQSNKIHKCIELFDTIDSVDSIKLSKKINNRVKRLNINIPVLLEINTVCEPKKYGFFPEEIDKMLECFENRNLKIQGLMTIAPFHQKKKETHRIFRLLREIKEDLNRQKPQECEELKELSMGMSSDFEVAVEEGSTQVRIGTALLGKRN